MMTSAKVRIDVWSDYVCPFCYLAEPTLAAVESEYDGGVSVTWRAFELRPEPVPTLDPKGDYLRDIWARAVYPMAAARGMTLHLPPVQPRSRLAHEAAVFARQHGFFREMNEALFRAFFENGEDIGNIDIISRIGSGLGLDQLGLRQALETGMHRAQVLEDENLAQALVISGVPAMAVRLATEPIDEAVIIAGAQPFEVLQEAIARVSSSA